MQNYEGKPCRNGHLNNRTPSGQCRDCQRAAIQRWKKRNPEKYKARMKKDSARRGKLNRHGYNEAAKIRMREYYRKKKGIPAATRPVPEHCECCGSKLEGGRKTHLDHCHETGAFRGWLCNQCNMGIGALGDSIEGLERAIAYLKRAYSCLSSAG